MVHTKWCNVYCSFGIVLSCVVISAHSDISRPRGVSVAKASLYTPTKDFTCLDGTVTIPFSYVNDDYCDCFDGSDEPGTSACLNGVFHCTNAGHQAQNIPSSRVNDGVCDCCDGTDEYASRELCTNTCELLGREAEAEAQRLSELLKAGSVIRQELIEMGSKKQSDMAEQLSTLEQDKAEADQIKQEMEALKNEIEAQENEALSSYRAAEEEIKQKKAEEEQEANRKEAEIIFIKYDSNNDGHLNREEVQTRNAFDKDRDGEVTDEEFKYFFGEENESIDFDYFVDHVWPLLKPFIMMEQGIFHEENNVETEADEDGGGEDEHEDLGLDDETEGNEELEEQEDRVLDLQSDTKYDEETQKIIDAAREARKQYTDIERKVREIESNIRNIRENMGKDYGRHQEYAALDGQCFEYEDKEYVYKLCMFQRVTQKPKDGAAEVGLGNWGEWAGDSSNPYSTMKYTNGIACWNGPSRITTVHIQCGLENKLLSVTEPFRCEYKAELSTPAACDPSRATNQAVHDEL